MCERWPDLLFRPAKILANQFVEFLIMFDEELTQLGHHYGIDPRMLAAFRLPQALVAGFIAQAVETFRLVEIKVVATDAGLDS